MKQQEKETLKAIEDFKNIIDSSWKTGRYILSTDKVEQLRVLIIKAYKAGYAVETMNTKPERDKVMDKFNEIFPDVKRIPNPVIRKSRTTETTPKYIEEFEKEIKSNSYFANQHEGNEFVLKASRAIEIVAEHLTKTIESERERVIGEAMKYVNNKQFASTDYDTNLLVQSMMKTIRSELFNKLKRKDE